MINELNHNNAEIAEKIYHVFQCAYTVEAELIGARHFPPLEILAEDIQKTNTQFFGYWEGKQLTAVVEITRHTHQLDIDSLVVDPDYFRQGRASHLLQFILNGFEWKTATVETALANKPALALYRKAGFSIQDEWNSSEGIRKVALSI